MKKSTKIVAAVGAFLASGTGIALIALVLVAALMLGAYFATRPQPEEGAKNITVTVVHKDKTEKVFPVNTDEEYLAPVLVSEGIVEDNQGDYGLYILVADGELADYNADGGWWAVYEGDTQATVGASELVIKDGGSYKLVYTIGWS